MARNVIESDFRTSKMAAGSHFVKYKNKKFRIDLKWPEMWSKVNLGHPKWPTAVILSNISKNIKVAYRSEMARNAIESEFRTSKMGAGGHFIKKFKKKSFVLIWNGQKCHRKCVLDIQNGHRQPFCKKVTILKLWYWSEMVSRNFSTSKLATGGHLKKLSEWFELCSNRLLVEYNLI